MDADQVTPLLLRKLGIRVGPAMATYVARQLAAAGSGDGIPVIGGDARTGVPVRKVFRPDASAPTDASAVPQPRTAV